MMEISYIALFCLLGVLMACLWQVVSFTVDALYELVQHKSVTRTIASRRHLRLRGVRMVLPRP